MIQRGLNSDSLHKAVKNRKYAVAKVKKHRVELKGDSHIKTCSKKSSNSLNDSCNRTGIT